MSHDHRQYWPGTTSRCGIIASRLPFEIVSLVVSFLTGPKSVLLPLTLVSRHWTSPVHACIYRKIVIHRERQWPWLVWTLHVNPSFRLLVRTLKITVYIPYDQRRIGHEITANLFPRLQEAVYFWSAIDFSFLYTLAAWAPSTLKSLYVGIDSVGVLRYICDFLRHHQDWEWDELTFDIRPSFPMDCQGPHLESIRVRHLNFLENVGDHACPSKPPVSLNLLVHSCLEDMSSLELHFFPTHIGKPNFDGGSEVPIQPWTRHDGQYITLQRYHLAFHNFKEINHIERFQLFWLDSLFKSRQYTLETGTANLTSWDN